MEKEPRGGRARTRRRRWNQGQAWGAEKGSRLEGQKSQRWGKRRDRAKGVKGDIRELTFNRILGLPWGE